MWLFFLCVIIGFGAGFYFDLPLKALSNKYIALILLAVLDSLTFSLSRDLVDRIPSSRLTLIRLFTALIFGGFVIYYGEKSGLDLYLVALIPLGVSFALNLYKFLPK
ncbi:MAG TPA: DUF1290 domain-containing protein [bacterium]|jgi:small basic protein